jgi:tetratricopeptide (TPR) repeat protein
MDAETTLIEQTRELLKQNRVQDAQLALHEGLKKHPKSMPLHLELVRIALMLANQDEAKKLIDEASKINPNDLDLVTLQGVWYIQQEQYLQAATVLKWVTSQSPQNDLAWMNLGVAFNRLGALENAKEALTKATELAPRNAQYHFELGMVFAALGEYIKAPYELEQCILLAPDVKQYHEIMVNLLISIGDLHTAVRICEEAQKIFTDHDIFAEQRANLSELMGDVNQALAQRLTLAQTRINYGDHIKIGCYYWMLKDAQKSREHFAKALSLDKAGWEAYFNLAKINEAENNITGAIQMLTTAIDEAKIKPGVLYNELGALPYLDTALKLDHNSPYALVQIAIAHRDLGEIAEAKQSAQKAFKQVQGNQEMQDEVSQLLASLNP